MTGRAAWTVLAAAIVACSTAPVIDADAGDAAVDVGPRPTFDGSGPDAVACGPETCDAPPELAAVGIFACCNEGGGCGFESTRFPGCLDLAQPGSLDPACPDVPVRTGPPLPGCCAPDGTCGGQDSRFGCVPGSAIGSDGGTCLFDPNNACTAFAEAVCDGPEDCDDGERCCARLGGTRFDRFECLESCVGRDTRGEVWFEICHAGAPRNGDCERLDFVCRPGSLLPDFLLRCGPPPPSDAGPLDAGDAGDAATDAGPPDAAPDAPPFDGGPPGQVQCGDAVCSDGGSCCLRPPLSPVCVEPGRCGCDPRRVDASTDAGGDASVDAASD